MTDALIVSNAKDTNGQNARYAMAAEKHGMSEEIITSLAVGKYDPAGVVARYAIAAERLDVGLRIRSAHRIKYDAYDFPGGIVWDTRTKAIVRQWAKEADVIHLNNSDIAVRPLGIHQKPMLLHHHGSMFRNNPQRLLDIARSRKMVQAVSTIDLQRPAPDLLHWLPTSYDMAALAAIGREHGREPDGRIRIVHCPTGPKVGTEAYKHTELFTGVVHDLIAEGLPIDLVVLRDVPQAEVFRAKAKADIVYDQLLYGYGCNAVEAWGMGKAVISGGDEWTERRMKSLWGSLPYEHATERTLKSVIKRLVLDPARRYDVAQRGIAHALKYHDDLPALTILAELYHEAIKVRQKVRIEGKGITFRSNRSRIMHVDGLELRFRGGVETVTDEIVIGKLRHVVKNRPRFGISEDEGVA